MMGILAQATVPSTVGNPPISDNQIKIVPHRHAQKLSSQLTLHVMIGYSQESTL